MGTLEALLRKSRMELLDLSTRNRLLSLPTSTRSARVIEVHDERSEEVYRLLVTEAKALSFLPGSTSGRVAGHGDGVWTTGEAEAPGLPQPEEDEGEAGGLQRRHVDARLQTLLTPEGLQQRLLDLHRDARTMVEEQGVNILYLALGQLQWMEDDKDGSPRRAPLLLIPVELARRSAADRFVLRWTGDEIEENLSLRTKLKSDFGLDLPPFPTEEGWRPAEYLEAMGEEVRRQEGWEVLPNAMVLGFFSFAKFLMYRDLDPANWPQPEDLLEQPFIRALLQDGFPVAEPLLPEDADLDGCIPVDRLDHVVDADSSQTRAIEAVRQGRSLVIQGPPGTGKSQSIANIIATAVSDGKRVLFVAEKLAALEVVQRRLAREGLGDLCLELHSNKSNKRAVIEELGRTWKLGRPKAALDDRLMAELEARRNSLNRHVAVLHEADAVNGWTAFEVLGQLSRLGSRGSEAGDVSFPGAEMWTGEERRRRRSLWLDMAGRVAEMGLPSQHPWRGVGIGGVLRMDLETLLGRMRQVQASVSALEEAAEGLAGALGQPKPVTFRETDHLRLMGKYVVQAPSLDRASLGHSVWAAGLDGLRELLTAGRAWVAARGRVGDRVLETVWQADWVSVRMAMAAHGGSWLRMFNGAYRQAMATIRGSLKGDLPKAQGERVAFLDAVVEGQQACRQIREGETLGRSAFGSVWRGLETDWEMLQCIVDWVERQEEEGLGLEFRRMFMEMAEPSRVGSCAEVVEGRWEGARSGVERLFEELVVDCRVAFGVDAIDQVPLGALGARLGNWLGAADALSGWSAYHARAREARDLGWGAMVDRLEGGEVPVSAAEDAFDRVYYGQVLRAMVERHPELGRFDGRIHDRLVAEFRQLDRDRLALAKQRVLTLHHDQLPPLHAGVGAAGIVKAEMERKRGHRTVRRLLKDAGTVVQAIKPVFMMSPLSVAQFLEPGGVSFDLLVMDEASQVEPVDALGSVARARQMVVVGDSQQLPPTRFFTRLTSGGEGVEDRDGDGEPLAAEAQEVESILGLCRARGLPETLLSWHYRSRHHSLIAVSNHEFYGNRLFIVPSPVATASGLGLSLHRVPEGVFDRGGSGTNRVEAQAIGRSVMEHIRNHPELSLGVAAFSVRQQEAILDELEWLRRQNPENEPFFAAHPAEPFFVKNLENVQGDERDVIFISVGYGRDGQGQMAMRFGPLGQQGGERRLNVLISRARRRCEVFASITADDVDLERASGRGVAALKTFLAFAENGRIPSAQPTGPVAESLFEEGVRQGIESLGYQVHTRVGLAGLYIDLAVVDPEVEGRYVLGVECDGATYGASRFARDRDRLRQAVLADHGWVLHRVWSADWFQRPTEQLQRLATVLEQAREGKAPRVEKAASVGGTVEESLERESVPEGDVEGLEGLSVPYEEARFAVPTEVAPTEMSTRELAAMVVRILKVEGPLHEDEVVSRVRDLWGLGRVGSRLQEAVTRAVRSLLVTRKCEREDGFLMVPGGEIRLRHRGRVGSVGLRKPEMLPPAELRAAMLAVLEAGHGATGRELVTAVARLLGFKSTGPQLRALIERQRDVLMGQGQVTEVEGMFRRVGG
jgi:very-short-patch-repair endonuclease